MAVYTLENTHVRVKFQDDATYKLVLLSIENLDDGSSITFPPQDLFRAITRDVGTTDSFEPPGLSSNASSYIVDGTGYDATTFHLGSNYESPALGGRKWFQATFTYTVPGDSLKIYFTAQILDANPDRLRFTIYIDTKRYNGGLTTTGLFWVAPILLKVTPYASDHYLLGNNGGIVTRTPKVDLVGNGSTYRFITGRNPAAVSAADELVPAVGFEPETKSSQFADRMEVFYPTWMSSAVSAYGDRSSAGATLYVHDELQFKGRRFLDYYSGGFILLESEQLIENGITAANGWTIAADADLRGITTYVKVFKRTGQSLGEDLAIDYRKWSLTSKEGLAILPAKPKDRPDMCQPLQIAPMQRFYFNQDDEGETQITKLIADETRIAFPALRTHMLYRTNYDTLFPYFQDASATHPGKVGDAMPDLWNLHCDQAKKDYSLALKGEPWCLWTFVFNNPRRPTPYDGLDYWTTYAMDAARVKNHLEAVNPGTYKTTDQWLKVTKTVNGSPTYNSGTGFTKVTLAAGALDPSLWNNYSSYPLITQGIDHAAHADHLGWLKRSNGAYAFDIERQVQADFTANPAAIYVAGDQTATILNGHTLNLFFLERDYIPGYDAGVASQVGDSADTSLCAMADPIGNQGATSTPGWATAFIQQFITEARPHFVGLMTFLTRQNLVCWGTHGGETPGSNHQILAWRRVLAALRAQVGQPFQYHEEDGPYDWLLGVCDGHTRPTRRLDITTLVANPSGGSGWGTSPFFYCAWGDYYRMGAFQGGFEGHMTNFGGPSIYEGNMELAANKAKYREALGGDFMLGMLPSFGVSPEDIDMGDLPGGGEAYTPFFHPTLGMDNPESLAALFARLVQVNLNFEQLTLWSRRTRSLARAGTTTVDYSPLATSYGHEQFHSIGVDEYGTKRAPVMHAFYQHHSSDRKFYALFVNDHIGGNAESYSLDPSVYDAEVATGTDHGYRLTRYIVSHDGVTATQLGQFTGTSTIAVDLGPGEVEVYLVEFLSGAIGIASDALDGSASISFVEGDTFAKVTATFSVDLTGATVELAFRVLRGTGRWPSSRQLRAMVVTNAASGVAEFEFAAGDLQAGVLRAEAIATLASGQQVTTSKYTDFVVRGAV